MKKITRVLIVLLILSMFLTACSGGKKELIGRWELYRGDYTYFFYAADEVEFFADGTVIEFDYREVGEWKIISKGRLQVICEDGTIRLFDYSVDGNRLTLTDEDGDRDVYNKIR